jgi:DNA-binding transcriptional MocR family regulator
MVIVGESAVTIRDLESARVDDGADSHDVQGAVLDALGDLQPHSPREIKKRIADEFGCSWKKVQRAADALEAAGLIRREGATSKATWTLDNTSPSQMSKDAESLETLDESLFGHTTERGHVQSPHDHERLTV